MSMYTVDGLARLSGVSPRTIRYYDSIGLLTPARVEANGYRVYGTFEVDRLQDILFYRELGMELSAVRELLDSPDYARETALEGHLAALIARRGQVELMIRNVENTLLHLKGETIMKDEEKFSGLKNDRIEQNEKRYGAELRSKYGNSVIDASNEKLRGMDRAKWDRKDALEKEIAALLCTAVKNGGQCSEADEAARLHKEWICLYWPDGMYTKEAHCSLCDSYLADERFIAYYDAIAPGAAAVLRDAVYNMTE